jgi:hypothetical protein
MERSRNEQIAACRFKNRLKYDLNRNQIAIFQDDLKQIKSFYKMANYSCLFSTFINLYYIPKYIENFFKKLVDLYGISFVFMLFIKCFVAI